MGTLVKKELVLLNYLSDVYMISDKHELFCDFCGAKAYFVDDKYIDDYGLNTDRPKISIKCNNCYLGQLRGGVLVLNYGLISKERVNEMSDQTVVTRRSKATVEELRKNLNWDNIKIQIQNKSFKLSVFAAENNANPLELRDLLEAQFGQNVIFKRGRNGGVFWNETNNN